MSDRVKGLDELLASIVARRRGSFHPGEGKELREAALAYLAKAAEEDNQDARVEAAERQQMGLHLLAKQSRRAAADAAGVIDWLRSLGGPDGD